MTFPCDHDMDTCMRDLCLRAVCPELCWFRLDTAVLVQTSNPSLHAESEFIHNLKLLLITDVHIAVSEEV